MFAAGARRLRSACFEADGAQEEFVSLQAAKRQRGGTIQSACALLSRYHAMRWHQITNGSRRTQVGALSGWAKCLSGGTQASNAGHNWGLGAGAGCL